MFQAHLVVASGIVHESIDLSKVRHSLLDGFRAILRLGNIESFESTWDVSCSQFVLQSGPRLRIAVHDYWDCSFRSESMNNGCADSLGAPCDYHDLVFQLQIHALASEVE